MKRKSTRALLALLSFLVSLGAVSTLCPAVEPSAAFTRTYTDALLPDPRLQAQRLLFVKRYTYHSSHEYGTLCDAPDHLATAVLFRMDGDGSNIEQLTNSAVSEFSPSIMQDGRVLYTRWEYVDKGQFGIKCLWAMRPDGSGSVEIYGNDIHLPPTFLHGRQIPGQSNMFIMLGTPHYPQSGIGTVIRVDTTETIRTRAPMTYMTPFVDIRQEPGWNHYENGKWSEHTRGPLYMDPYPLSDDLFLVAHNPDKDWDDPRAYGLYLLNDTGAHQKLHTDPEISCWQPTPLQVRVTAPVMPGPQPGDTTGQQVIHFPSYVQPVLDKHCVTCHGSTDPEGDFDLTGTMTDRFSRSYESIMERELIKTYREASDWGGSPYVPPKTIGSHASPFIMALLEGEQHRDLDLSLADFARLATWVDASGVYYGSYWGRRRLKYKDHPNFRPVPTFAEALSTICPLPVDQR